MEGNLSDISIQQEARRAPESAFKNLPEFCDDHFLKKKLNKFYITI